MRKHLLIILCFTICACCFSQSQNKVVRYDSDKFTIRVKTLDDFISRFNHDTTYIKSVFDLKKVPPRQDMLFTLIDQEIEVDSATILVNNNSLDFIDNICHGKNLISFYDDQLYATGTFPVTNVDTEIKVTITFKLESSRLGSRWVVVGVSEDIAAFKSLVNTNDSLIIPPTNNDIAFGSFSKVAELNCVSCYNSSDYFDNALILLNSLVSNGVISIGACEGVKYHFLQIPNWVFIVESVDHVNDNQSGWLITGLKPAEVKTKENYKETTLYCR
jgi:hypothetical protein